MSPATRDIAGQQHQQRHGQLGHPTLWSALFVKADRTDGTNTGPGEDKESEELPSRPRASGSENYESTVGRSYK